MNIESLFYAYKDMVFNLALQYVQQTEDAEEITQDVFVSIYKNQAHFKQNASLKTWIYRITINHCLDFIKAKKRKKRFARISSIFFPDQGTTLRHDQAAFDHPGVLLEQREATQAIFDCINQLPHQQKTALILTKIEGLSQLEAAQVMDLSPKAVESLVQRAKNNLAKKLDQNEGL